MKEKIRKVLLDSGIEIVGEGYKELYLRDDIAIRIYNHNEEGIISWCVEDFEGAAREYVSKHHSDATPEEQKDIYLAYFDESKFPYALARMIDKADHSIGITWDTVDYYLHEYCLREEEF